MELIRVKGIIFGTSRIICTLKLARSHRRLHLVFIISPLPPYGFMSNLVSPESSHRGESNRFTFITRVQDSTENVGKCRNQAAFTISWSFHGILHRLMLQQYFPLTPKSIPLNSTSIWTVFGVVSSQKGWFHQQDCKGIDIFISKKALEVWVFVWMLFSKADGSHIFMCH